ncbi:MAG: DNA internalization-related competence protein ComEC/Rec2 [Thermoanaerobacteraceae bacterium]|nr:DNA internalization-related competence protein ComEC/Rec2 [Thermoanaerobacteraceae bacterium]
MIAQIVLFATAVIISLFTYLKRQDITVLILLDVMFFGIFYSMLFFNVNSMYESGREYVLDVMVYDSPMIEDYRTSYIVKPEKGQAILLNVYNSNKIYKYGDTLRIRVKTEIPKGETNPGGFNYRDYLKKKGIYATASISEKDILYIGHKIDIRTPFINSREWIENIINKLYPGKEAAFLNSLIIGDRTDLESDVEDSFINTGIIHALAISGLHVNILLLFIFYVLKLFKLSEVKRNITALSFIGFYTLTVGAMPSVTRAFIMAAVVLIGNTYDEEIDVLSGIALAAFIILFINPLNLFDIGFQLSFGATLAILLIYRKLSGLIPFKGYIADAVSSTISAEIGVLPVSIYYFFRLPVYSLLANLIIVPLIPVIFVLGIISIILGSIFWPMSYIFVFLNTMLIRLSIAITGQISSLPYSAIPMQRPYIAVIAAYYIFVFISLGFIKISYDRYVSACLALFIFLGIYFEPICRNMNITFIDVGQGDSSLIRHGRTKILVDAGGSVKSKGSDFDVGEDVLIPFLLSNHVTSIDVVFVSHTDNDHMGGLLPLIEKMKVKHIFLGEEPENNALFNRLKETARSKNIPISYLKRGDRVSLGKINIQVLNPSENKEDVNNTSLVFKLSYKDADVLYTGDIEMKGEADMLKSDMDLDADILKVAHHGSSTSSTRVFLDKVKPAVSIISVGKNNYGHPDDEVLLRLSEYSRVYRTDNDGAVIINTDGKYIKVKSWSDKYGL